MKKYYIFCSSQFLVVWMVKQNSKLNLYTFVHSPYIVFLHLQIFVITKKASQNPMDKLGYLQQQNQQLHEEIQDLKELLKMNKVQIDILSAQLQSNPHHKKLIDVVLAYRQKEEKSFKNISILKQQISKLNSQNLLLKQMNDSFQEEFKNNEKLNRQAVEIYNEKNKSLEEKLVYYERNFKQYDKVSGFVLKNRDIIGPNQVALELREKEEEWKDQIAIMKAQVEQAKKNSQNLMVINTVLRNKIVSLQAKLAMPNKNMGEVLDKSLKKLMLYFIQVQKKIITGEQDSDSDSQNDLQLIAPELTGLFPDKQLRSQRDYGVPHIDLLKIREQINHSTNKIKQALLARNHLSDKQKIQRLEIQLEYTRRQLSRNIIDLRDEKQTRKRAQAFIEELQSRNQYIIESNKQLEMKVRKYWDRLQRQIKNNQGIISDTNDNTSKEHFSNALDETLVLAHPQRRKMVEKKPQNMFMMENMAQSQTDYKIHLQILAKELQKNEKLKNLSKLKNKVPKMQEGEMKQMRSPTKMKRSTSNPFLYFNERRGEIMEIKNEDGEENDQKVRLEQTCFNPGESFGYEELLDQVDV